MKMKKIIAAITAAVCMIMIFSGCSSPKASPEETVKAVVTQLYTCPDKVLQKSIGTPTIGAGASGAADMKKFAAQIQKKYGDYVSNELLAQMQTGAVGYIIEGNCERGGYTLTVQNVDVVVTDSHAEFTVAVAYTKATEDGELTLSGNAQLDETGKVSWIDLYDASYDLLQTTLDW